MYKHFHIFPSISNPKSHIFPRVLRVKSHIFPRVLRVKSHIFPKKRQGNAPQALPGHCRTAVLCCW